MKIFKIVSSSVISVFFVAAMSSFNINAMEQSPEKIEEKEQCVICTFNYDEEKRKRHFLPCTHKLCVTCAGKVKKCPFCRSKISEQKAANIGINVQRESPIPYVPSARDAILEVPFEHNDAFNITACVDAQNVRPVSGSHRAGHSMRGNHSHRGMDFVKSSKSVKDTATQQGPESFHSTVRRWVTIQSSPQEELHFGCMQGNLDRVRLVLCSVENPYEIISAPCEREFTALHWAAARGGNKDIVLMLIEIAKQEGKVQDLLSLKTSVGETALDLAILWNNLPHDNTEIIKVLESYSH